MTMPRLAALLLLTSALTTPAMAHASDPASAEDEVQDDWDQATDPDPGDLSDGGAAQEEEVEISLPGGIVVTGRRSRDVARIAPQVVSVLSAEQIERTGEGDIAGALSRVTGLSVVGNGFVYVRGLGDRYSLALLNGSPLPSPEPLKRVVPLDLFPTSVIASSLVQKSYSANFPGEFGGGVINLTTKAAPDEGFIEISYGMSWDSETTNQLGYTYFGSKTDWTGYDNGARNIPPALAAFFKSGERISSNNVDSGAIAKQLVNPNNSLLQRYDKLPPNFSGGITAGKSFELGSTTLGVIATMGYSNKWTSRAQISQSSLATDLAFLDTDFYNINTDNRVVVNGLLGFGLEFGRNRIRWTNLYIHDTVKNAILGEGSRPSQNNQTLRQQRTAWYERQLINTQLVGEFQLTDALNVNLRGGYANSKRKAPFELFFEYARSNQPGDQLGQYFLNLLNNGQQGDAQISFSDLDEDLWSAGVDISYRISPAITATAGYAYSDTRRISSKRDFKFTAPSDMPRGVGLLRPDRLLGPAVIEAFSIRMIETNEATPAFLATLENHAAYIKANVQLGDAIEVDAGVRYEKARQVVEPVQVFNTPGSLLSGTTLNNEYWLPTATVTWSPRDDMKLRANASQTIARPQFREQLFQFYFDPDTNRQYRGNPALQDSKLTNAELRYEWYFAPDQRLSVAGFFKKIDRPIETFISSTDGNTLVTSFANAPRANLWGAELELQKYFDLESLGGSFWTSRRVLVVANYTYSKSKLKVGPDDTVQVFPASGTLATDYFTNGAPLTGQSDHLVNLQIGLEDRDRLSQQTFLVSYASNRVVSRGLNNSGQPDAFEKPGVQLDFVARQGIKLFNLESELKFEARNLLGTDHRELQRSGDNIVILNSYKVGRIYSLSASVKF
jgi:TonB-dependent receptor